MRDANTIAPLMRRVDAFVDIDIDGSRGWHTPNVKVYTTSIPAIQQVRSEYEEFLQLCVDQTRDVIESSVCQIGLGIGGGAHFALTQIFDRAVTVECDQRNVARYLERERAYDPALETQVIGPNANFTLNKPSQIVFGFSNSQRVLQSFHQRPWKFDCLFIDGDHTLNGVATDWACYEPLVKPGGFVVFHDLVPQTERIHERAVHVFVDWLKSQPFAPVENWSIGDELGLFVYRKDEELAPKLDDSMKVNFIRLRQ